MASSKARQRRLARVKYERRMVRQAQRLRWKRQVQAGVGAFLALALIVLGSVWLLGGFESEPGPQAEPRCNWAVRDAAAEPDLREVGTPPQNPPEDGARTMTLAVDAGDVGSGDVEVTLDVAADPCAAASLEYLAGQGFYDGTTCHEVTLDGALHCGDPTGTGRGGPAYTFYGENVPYPSATESESADEDVAGPEKAAEPEVLYPKGTVALVGWPPGSLGSQFLIFYEDFATEAPTYAIVGTVTAGLDLVEAVGVAAEVADEPVAPAEGVRITTVTVTDPATTPTDEPDES